MLMSQVGRDRSIDADYPFELEVPGFDIFDFHRGTEIVTEAGKSLSGTTIEEILGAYREDASRRF
jgi:hypothetical protein